MVPESRPKFFRFSIFSGRAAAATELAVVSMAQQILQRARWCGGPRSADACRRRAAPQCPELDALAIIESGELPAKRIGSSYRVKPSELDAYLSR